MPSDWYNRFLQNPLLLPASTRAANGGKLIMAALEQYRLTERLPPAELGVLQRTLLLGVAQHAAVQSPHFARRLAADGLTPATLSESGGLRRLRPLTRRELFDAKEDFFCRAVPPGHGKVAKTSTSGSTGEPVVLRRTERCQLHWQAQTLREHLWHELDFSARFAVVRANIPELSCHPDWGLPCSRVLRTGQARLMSVKRSLEEIRRGLAEFQPAYLLLYSTLLAHLVEACERDGQRPEGLRGIRTLGETVSGRLREHTRRVLGLEIADTYSSQEGGVMATQCPEQGAYHVSETIILEVVNARGEACAPGETGRVLVTDLLNFATPLVRYEIGDHAEAGEARCPCGRGLPVIRRFLGRERNLVLLPDGSRRWPQVGFYEWPEIFAVRQFQLTQVDRHTIEARFAADHRPTAEQEGQLVAVLHNWLGYPFDIHCHWQAEPLPRGPGGKFEEFVCLAR